MSHAPTFTRALQCVETLWITDRAQGFTTHLDAHVLYRSMRVGLGRLLTVYVIYVLWYVMGHDVRTVTYLLHCYYFILCIRTVLRDATVVHTQ